ncbi:two-pore potassium channel 1-like protein [Tanacetum coccineum]
MAINSDSRASPTALQDTSLVITDSEPENDESPLSPKSFFDIRKVAIVLCIYLGVGTVCFYLVRRQISGKKTNGILDALYLTVISLTSVSYGDLSPDTTLTILLTSLFAFLGMLLIGLVLTQGADFMVEKQELLMAYVLNMHKTGDTTKLQKQMESNKLRNKCIMLVVLFVVLMVVGTTVLVFVEDLDIIHAFYCIIAMTTSVGSDQCFSTEGGRVFALFWILFGSTYLGELLFTYSELHTEMRQKELVKWILQRKITTADMDAADLDDDGFVCRSEYVLYKLKELGVINQEDVLPIMEDFKRLDSKIVAPPQQDVDISMEEIYASELQNVVHRPHQKRRHRPLSPPRNFPKEIPFPHRNSTTNPTQFQAINPQVNKTHRSEYVLYKLKELGVINQEDVLPIMEDFKRLDSKIVAPPQQDVDISMEEIYASELQNVVHRPHQKRRHRPLSPPRNFSEENSLPPPRSMTAFEYKKAGVVLLIYLGAGTISFYLVRHQISGTKTNGIIDALYLTVVLLTCVGYGDLSPDTTLTILIATFFSLFGILLILLVLSITAQLLVQKQEVLMTNVLNLHQTVDATKLQTRVEFNTARKKCVLLVVMLVAIIAVGAVVLVRVEDLDFIHALYCVLATIIGVGSDRCFSTIGGRVFALFWMLSGTIYLGELLFRFTELLTQWRRRPSAECAVKTKPMDAQMVEAADIDDDGVIKASEYIIHILLETGKISQEDMAPILKQFDTLDVDNKRKLALRATMYRQTYV